ncbi:DUF2515 family protein [Oceanobacillus salinisoli]|uniref:DUF2515 family protein n=1 Tax=Oceanobacillus salinisoli TaxID=2678611 RepID=UPI0012E18E70|nr:DUF2515 family protein [Oceanobacillus salinisoli]
MNREQDYIHYISKLTKSQNVDNISRTKAYLSFYLDFPEIKWSLLASIVSRNAGWNMTDLHLAPFQTLLGKKEKNELFMTYERANWLIFSDAFPQLLVYKLSKRNHKPMFHLLSNFHVSKFMVKEWYRYWKTKNKDRLMNALIINEQNVIHDPVIKQPYFKKHVFYNFPYMMQDFLFMSAVILPTKSKGLYGIYISRFTNLAKRIETGKEIASILFSNEIYPDIMHFLLTVEHTGSRYDYEKYYPIFLPRNPMLRFVYPVISHKDIIRNDWFKYRGVKSGWFQTLPKSNKEPIGKKFYSKRILLFGYAKLRERV